MSAAILPSPPPGVRMRPFRIIPATLEACSGWDGEPSLKTEEVVCIGPLNDNDASCLVRRQTTHGYARRRVYLCIAEEAQYLMHWRVAAGRPRKVGNWDASPRKLAHWDSLEPGVAMMLCPKPDDAVIEGAIARTNYLRSQCRGRFQPFFDKAGALWVAKLLDAP